MTTPNPYWLIEHNDRGQVEYVTAEYVTAPQDRLQQVPGWTADVHKAHRFVSREEAEWVRDELRKGSAKDVALEVHDHEDVDPPAEPWSPAALGRQVVSVTRLDPIPWKGRPGMLVELHCHEFTSRCPVTKQPDFAELFIRYSPKDHIVETKSLKLWLQQFREVAAFNEVLTDALCNTFADAIRPAWVEVEMRFKPRGGIAPMALARWDGPEVASVLRQPEAPPTLGSAVRDR